MTVKVHSAEIHRLAISINKKVEEQTEHPKEEVLEYNANTCVFFHQGIDEYSFCDV